MKKCVLIFLILSCLSCKKEEAPLYSFGDIELGMSLESFEKKFHDKNRTIAFDNYVTKHFETLVLNPKITLTNVNLDFMDKELIIINCNYNKELFGLLEKKHGISSRSVNRNTRIQYVIFKTPDSIQCAYESRSNKDKSLGLLNIIKVTERNNKNN